MTIEQIEVIVRGLPTDEKIKLIDILSRQIEEDEANVPGGRSVALDVLTSCWKQWVEQGPQGPIDDDPAGAEFP
jgi:hypothetical protein